MQSISPAPSRPNAFSHRPGVAASLARRATYAAGPPNLPRSCPRASNHTCALALPEQRHAPSPRRHPSARHWRVAKPARRLSTAHRHTKPCLISGLTQQHSERSRRVGGGSLRQLECNCWAHAPTQAKASRARALHHRRGGIRTNIDNRPRRLPAKPPNPKACAGQTPTHAPWVNSLRELENLIVE